MRVSLQGSDNEPQVFYFSAESTVGECKETVLDHFKVKDSEERKKYTLYRVDAFGEPAFPIRKEAQGWSKNNVCTGDLLVLKSSSQMTVDERMSLGVSLTTTGLPDDCTFLGDIEVSREFSLKELKQTILTMGHF